MQSESKPLLANAWEFLHRDRPDLAEREARRCLAAEPDDAEARAVLAMALAFQRKYGEALAEAEEAVRLAPDDECTRDALTVVHLRRGDGKRAEPVARGLLETDPLEPRYHELLSCALRNRVGEKLFSGGLAREALKAAERGLSIDPEHVGCMIQKAYALVDLRRLDEAKAVADEVLRLQPDRASSHTLQGVVKQDAGKRREGRLHLREALRMKPNDPFVLRRLGPIREQGFRDRAAILVQLREWRTPLRIMLALQLAAICFVFVHRGGDAASYVSLLPLPYVFFPRVLAHVNRDDRHLDRDAAGMDAFLAKERRGARFVIALYPLYAIGAIAAALAL